LLRRRSSKPGLGPEKNEQISGTALGELERIVLIDGIGIAGKEQRWTFDNPTDSFRYVRRMISQVDHVRAGPHRPGFEAEQRLIEARDERLESLRFERVGSLIFERVIRVSPGGSDRAYQATIAIHEAGGLRQGFVIAPAKHASYRIPGTA